MEKDRLVKPYSQMVQQMPATMLGKTNERGSQPGQADIPE